jgi:riboflavin synthase
MFTGLIESIGAVTGFSRKPAGAQIEVSCDFTAQLKRGDSVAVDGTCLTAIEMHGNCFTADVSTETLAKTTLGRMNSGRRVNLERAVAVGARMGGHYVLGHVDGLAKIKAIAPLGDAMRYDLTIPEALAPLIVPKGSIAIDGISLTVNEVGPDSFWVAVIPETQAKTTLSDRKAGDFINLEGDILGKFVLRSLALQSRGSGIDTAFLEKHGYL